jgi:DNA-3-methyladenine glycosylase
MTSTRHDTGLDSDFPPGAVLEAGFFARPSDEVAPDLIGKILWSPRRGGGRLTEVEAYLPVGDPASHAARGPTKRNAPMFGPPGSIYVFLSYGVHYLLNLVCDQRQVASAVLIRALEPLQVEGVGPGRGMGPKDASLCGPGRVGKALGIHPGLNGFPLGEPSGLFVVDDGFRPEVGVARRIGISRGETLPLRYYMYGSGCVSRRSVTQGGPFA